MKVASLFSGVGGLDLGFKNAGHELVWANDNYKDAVETYRINIGNHIVFDDIKNIKSESIPNHDILIGGFPCQGFSIANVNRSSGDERNQLYLEFLRIIQDKKPKFFVAENVKGILSLEKGKIIKMILNDFASAGYKVNHKVLNAANYGVPQRRERVIIIGVREDLDYKLEYPEGTHSNCIQETDRRPWVTVHDALKSIPDPDKVNSLKNHTYSKFKLKFNGYIGNRAIDPNKPAPTVTGRGDSKGGVVVLHHPNNKRRMSVRELALIQSFPIDFEFSGPNSSAYRQIGNAVPPDMALAIAKVFPINLETISYENTKEALPQL